MGFVSEIKYLVSCIINVLMYYTSNINYSFSVVKLQVRPEYYM